MSDNAILSWVNHLDAATLSASYSAPALPVANLGDISPSKPWMVYTTNSAWVRADLKSSKPIGIIAVQGLTGLGAADTWRIKVGTTLGGAEIYDSGTIALGHDPAVGFAFHRLPAEVTRRYVEVTFTGVANPFYIGRLWIGAATQLAINYSPGWGRVLPDTSQVSVAQRSGVEQIDIGYRQRQVQFTLDWVHASDYDAIRDMDRAVGTHGQILLIPEPAGDWRRDGMLGRLADASPLLAPLAAIDVTSKSISAQETL